MLTDRKIIYCFLVSDHFYDCFGNIGFFLHLFLLPTSPAYLNDDCNGNNQHTEKDYSKLIIL
jgi:hypothetical protein